jgi:adenine-specific DNA-methyltransferase
VGADREEVFERAEMVVGELNALARRLPGPAEDDSAPGGDDPFTETYCRASRYFHPANGRRIFTLREAIARKCLEPEVEAVVLTSLLEAADRVDSTTGVQMAYLKSWAPRALKDLGLRIPDILPRAAAGKGEAHRLDALAAAGALEGEIAYIDPPYNQHSYLGNYHIWETLVRWDHPEVYGAARKRVDCRTRRSDFNSRVRIRGALRAVILAARARTVIVSFSDEGYLTREDLIAILAERAGDASRIRISEHDYKRYVGAQIGIYNPAGQKVGTPTHLRNREFLFTADCR